jgi:hypothetical protein
MAPAFVLQIKQLPVAAFACSSAVGSQLSLLSVQVSFPWSADLLSVEKAVTPVGWSPCRPRTIQLPLTASPCSRLSRPQSNISQSDFHPVIRPFSPLRLGRSYRLAPEPDGSPLFTLLPLVACWRYEPREHLRLLALTRPLVPPSPLRDRVGYSDHDRFRGYIPVHFIPAYNLPVYASQRPLPVATQDSVRGCSLGFAAAVIADGRLQRACKAQPSQNRA